MKPTMMNRDTAIRAGMNALLATATCGTLYLVGRFVTSKLAIVNLTNFATTVGAAATFGTLAQGTHTTFCDDQKTENQSWWAKTAFLAPTLIGTAALLSLKPLTSRISFLKSSMSSGLILAGTTTGLIVTASTIYNWLSKDEGIPDRMKENPNIVQDQPIDAVNNPKYVPITQRDYTTPNNGFDIPEGMKFELNAAGNDVELDAKQCLQFTPITLDDYKAGTHHIPMGMHFVLNGRDIVKNSNDTIKLVPYTVREYTTTPSLLPLGWKMKTDGAGDVGPLNPNRTVKMEPIPIAEYLDKTFHIPFGMKIIKNGEDAVYNPDNTVRILPIPQGEFTPLEGMKMVLVSGIAEKNLDGTIKTTPITREDYMKDEDFHIPAGKKILVQVGSVRPNFDPIGRIQFEDIV